MGARRIVSPVLFLLFMLFLCFFWLIQSETALVSTEYTGGELIIFASSLNQDIEAVTAPGTNKVKKENSKFTFTKTLLGYNGKYVFYFGTDHVITKANFIFPASTSWNDVANRISEQLGEPSVAKLYNGGGAGAQWEAADYIFYLATDSKVMTLSVTNYYGDDK